MKRVVQRQKGFRWARVQEDTHKHTYLPSTPTQTDTPVLPHRHNTHTFDGADDLVQVFGVVAVWSTAWAYLQRVVRSILCKKLDITSQQSLWQLLGLWISKIYLTLFRIRSCAFIPDICTQTLQQSAKVHFLLFVSVLKKAAAFLEHFGLCLDFKELDCETDWWLIFTQAFRDNSIKGPIF